MDAKFVATAWFAIAVLSLIQSADGFFARKFALLLETSGAQPGMKVK
jgi:hypothetical protein